MLLALEPDLNTFGERFGNKVARRQFFIKYPICSGCDYACLTRWLSQSNKGKILSKTHVNLFSVKTSVKAVEESGEARINLIYLLILHALVHRPVWLHSKVGLVQMIPFTTVFLSFSFPLSS